MIPEITPCFIRINRCASELVQRKLFSESPDRFGLVQFGVEGAANPLEYPRVALMERGLAVADWQVGSFQYIMKVNVKL